MTEEAALVQRCLGGEEAAAANWSSGSRRLFSPFVSGCWDSVKTRKTWCRTLSWDFSKPQSVGLKRSLKPWILAIAANRCRTALKQRPRNAGRSLLLNQAVAAGSNDSRDLADELETAVGELRDDYRLCFLLFYQDDLSCAEIADVMSCPEGTVKTWLHRVCWELAERLRRRGVVPHVEYQLHRV